jgi:uncharacterized protein
MIHDVTPLPFHLLAKPTGAVCNLDCAYCFFLSKEELYPGSTFRMGDEVLEAYIRQLLEAQAGPETVVAWQGGEPTLMGLEFFERSVALVEKHRRRNQQVSHTIQTNGTRLDDAWCAFFKQHGFLVGLSVDGPRAMHDAYRVNKGGVGSFDEVMRGWDRLRSHGVDVNILCTVHAANGDHPVDVYRFFRDALGASFIQFIPIVERATPQSLPLVNKGWRGRARLKPDVAKDGAEAGRPLYTQAGGLVSQRSVRPAQWGRFLCAVFDEWVRRDVAKVFVQTFDVALGSWLGQHNLCIVSPTCGHSLALEHNGDLYSCDHYVEPGFLLGNILDAPLADLVRSEKQQAFGQDKYDSLPKYCRECEVLFACYGECPRNRFIETPDGEPGLNYLCQGYKAFFTHVTEPMNVMADLLRNGQPATGVMEWSLAREGGAGPSTRSGRRPAKNGSRGVGRNDPCPCGSGRKFKRCHGAAA